jgi:hypothetical protein
MEISRWNIDGGETHHLVARDEHVEGRVLAVEGRAPLLAQDLALLLRAPVRKHLQVNTKSIRE